MADDDTAQDKLTYILDFIEGRYEAFHTAEMNGYDCWRERAELMEVEKLARHGRPKLSPRRSR